MNHVKNVFLVAFVSMFFMSCDLMMAVDTPIIGKPSISAETRTALIKIFKNESFVDKTLSNTFLVEPSVAKSVIGRSDASWYNVFNENIYININEYNRDPIKWVEWTLVHEIAHAWQNQMMGRTTPLGHRASASEYKIPENLESPIPKEAEATLVAVYSYKIIRGGYGETNLTDQLRYQTYMIRFMKMDPAFE